MNEFRRLLTAAVERRLPPAGETVALCFSGGTDSLCVLWSLIDLKASVRAYTFHLEGRESNDARVARLAAAAYGVDHVELVIGHQTPAELAGDVAALVRRIGSARKTHVECTWPFTHLSAAVEERTVFCGLNADDLWGTSASDMIRYRRDPAGFRRAREARMAEPTTSAWAFISGLFADLGKTLHSPFRDPDVVAWFLLQEHAALNRPKQKTPAREGYAACFRAAPVWRPNDTLQCGSGIREYMARMLDDPRVNAGRATRVQALYRGWL